jgi:DNA-binding PucR family transcriptional regulator
VIIPPPESTVTRLRRATGDLASQALRRMADRLPWYGRMSAEDRSWVGLVTQAAVATFIAWYQDPSASVAVTSNVFGTAPRELTRSISLAQTLEMVRVWVDVVEEEAPQLAAGGTDARAAEQHLREAILRYSRDIAFAAATVYARAAETRGAWDARLEALVVDGLTRGEVDDELRSRAGALGWLADHQVAVLAGPLPEAPVQETVSALRRQAAAADGEVLIGVQHDRLVAVLGRESDPLSLAEPMARLLGPGPVVTGPAVASLAEAARSARAAMAGLAAVRGWPAAPNLVAADDLLPERLLAGDPLARETLLAQLYRPLQEANPALLETVETYLALGRSLEGSARALFVHPNTVRYRLGRVASITHRDPLDPRGGFTLQLAIAAGRISQSGT